MLRGTVIGLQAGEAQLRLLADELRQAHGRFARRDAAAPAADGRRNPAPAAPAPASRTSTGWPGLSAVPAPGSASAMKTSLARLSAL